MKKLKSLKDGDYLYIWKDTDYCLEDVGKIEVAVFPSPKNKFINFGWGLIDVNTKEQKEAISITISTSLYDITYRTSPPPKSHYKRNIKRRMKELELEISKLKFAKLALGMIK